MRVHGLVGDGPFPGTPSLPGPAAMVQFIPTETAPADELRAAGFVGLTYDKLGDIHSFRVNGVELRERLLREIKPRASQEDAVFAVMYHGPFRQVMNEAGCRFPRGERVCMDDATWRSLREPPHAEHFTCFSPRR